MDRLLRYGFLSLSVLVFSGNFYKKNTSTVLFVVSATLFLEGAEGRGDDTETSALNPVAASELADMVDSVESLWRDVRPLIDRWQTLLREDPAVPENEAVTT